MSLVAAAIAGLAATPARAAEPVWPLLSYDYIIIDEDIRDVLTEFGNNLRLPVKLTDRVKGRVRGGPQPAPPRAYLDDLSARFGLAWYYDGNTLHVSSSEEQRTEIVELGRLSSDGLMATLKDLGVADARYPIRLAQGGRVLSISGPPAYRDLIRQTVNSLMNMPPQGLPFESRKVRVFRGGSESSS